MITPIRIGGLVIHLSNLCYSRDLTGGEMVLFMTCGQLRLAADEAALLRRYLQKHSVRLDEQKREPTLPDTNPPQVEPKSIHQKTTLLITPPNRRRSR